MNRKERRIKHLRRQIREAAENSSEEDFPERVFRIHGALRFYVLWLLSYIPMNGSDIMEGISEQTKGRWKPSPGTIYPLLKSLVQEGFLIKGDEGQYHITDAGLEENHLLGIGDSFQDSQKNWRVGHTIEQIETLADDLEKEPLDTEEYRERIEELTRRFDDLSDRFN